MYVAHSPHPHVPFVIFSLGVTFRALYVFPLGLEVVSSLTHWSREESSAATTRSPWTSVNEEIPFSNVTIAKDEPTLSPSRDVVPPPLLDNARIDEPRGQQTEESETEEIRIEPAQMKYLPFYLMGVFMKVLSTVISSYHHPLTIQSSGLGCNVDNTTFWARFILFISLSNIDIRSILPTLWWKWGSQAVFYVLGKPGMFSMQFLPHHISTLNLMVFLILDNSVTLGIISFSPFL